MTTPKASFPFPLPTMERTLATVLTVSGLCGLLGAAEWPALLMMVADEEEAEV